jgi:hypothetical protein
MRLATYFLRVSATHELLRNPIRRSSAEEVLIVLIRESLLSPQELIHLRPPLTLIAFF